MILQNPLFLWGLLTLIIPVAVHLFQFRRTLKIYFSNTRLLQEVTHTTQAQQKLKHLLVLLARLLFLTFLVLAFCKPFIPAGENIQTVRQVILYLDNSPSMSLPTPEGISGLEAAVLEARKLLDVFPADTRYKLITNDFATNSPYFKSKSEIEEFLTGLRISPNSRSFREVSQRLGSAPAEVFFFSDFQQATLGPLTPDSANNWHFVPVPRVPVANVFIDTAFLTNPYVQAGERHTLQAQFQNEGSREVEQLVVTLLVNEVQSSSATLDIPARGTGTATFDLTPATGTSTRLTLQFNDNPVAYDNEHYFVIPAARKLRVVELTPLPRPTAVQLVYGNSAVFDYLGLNPDNLDNDAVQFADLVVLHGIDKPTEALLALLELRRQRGGAMVFIPGNQPDARWSRLIGPFQWQPNATRQELDKPNVKNPVFDRVFESTDKLVRMPAAIPALVWGEDPSGLWTFKDKRPFLSRLPGPAPLYLMAAPLEEPWSDLARHAIFVPLMYRLAATGNTAQSRSSYRLGERPIIVQGEFNSAEQLVTLRGTSDVIPTQRRVGREILLDATADQLAPGFYTLTSGADTLGAIAFNRGKTESLLEPYTSAELEGLTGAASRVTIFDAASTGAFANEINNRYLGVPLWKYALSLALVFALAEVLLIRLLK